VRRYALNVLHERDGVAEDSAIDSLQDVTYGSVAHKEDSAIRVVDVSAAVGRGAQKFAVDPEIASDEGGLDIFAHGESFTDHKRRECGGLYGRGCKR
jgi:hypothetical protein